MSDLIKKFQPIAKIIYGNMLHELVKKVYSDKTTCHSKISTEIQELLEQNRNDLYEENIHGDTPIVLTLRHLNLCNEMCANEKAIKDPEGYEYLYIRRKALVTLYTELNKADKTPPPNPNTKIPNVNRKVLKPAA